MTIKSASLPTGHPAPGSTGLRLNEEQREALSRERTGPYGGDDLGHETVVAAMTQALPANVEARKRMVAALARELDRPVAVRFPPEGRSCRVYRSNER